MSCVGNLNSRYGRQFTKYDTIKTWFFWLNVTCIKQHFCFYISYLLMSVILIPNEMKYRILKLIHYTFASNLEVIGSKERKFMWNKIRIVWLLCSSLQPQRGNNKTIVYTWARKYTQDIDPIIACCRLSTVVKSSFANKKKKR